MSQAKRGLSYRSPPRVPPHRHPFAADSSTHTALGQTRGAWPESIGRTPARQGIRDSWVRSSHKPKARYREPLSLSPGEVPADLLARVGEVDAVQAEVRLH